MPTLNEQTREITFRIVYVGPPRAGSTISLLHLHSSSSPSERSRFQQAEPHEGSTVFFDFTPASLPRVHGHSIKLHVRHTPIPRDREHALSGLLAPLFQHADGAVLVFPSHRARLDANRAFLEAMQREVGTDVFHLESDTVVQYNMRDAPDAVPVEELDRALNPHGRPRFATIANQGVGIFDAFKASVSRCIANEIARPTV